MNNPLKQILQKNRFYDPQAKELWLKNIEKLSPAEQKALAEHLQKNNERPDQLPPADMEGKKALLHILGKMTAKEDLGRFLDLLKNDRQKLTEEEWKKMIRSAEKDPDKMVYFFATLGPQGLDRLAMEVFGAFSRKKLNIPFEKFTKTIASISGLKQLIDKANREYMEEVKTIFLQECKKNQIAERSKLKRAEEIINNLLS